MSTQRVDFASVTEVTGYKVTKEQIKRMHTRYGFAANFCRDKEILEVACGSGQGLGYLAKVAKRVVGLDIDENLVALAGRYYQGRGNIEIRAGNAEVLPFNNDSFDVVILYEAIYYLQNPEAFIEEAKRVLRREGYMIICSANKEEADFNPSPCSHKYFSVTELFSLLQDAGFSSIRTLGDCSTRGKNIKDKLVSWIKRTAVKFHLIPGTMKGKEFFKRIFVGKLYPLPAEITEGMFDYSEPIGVPHDEVSTSYKVIYAVGQKI